MTAFNKQVSIHGKRAYLTEKRLVSEAGFVAGGENSEGTNIGGDVVLPGSPRHVAIFDDFIGDTGTQGNGGWRFVKGDTGTVSVGGMITGTNGVYRISSEPTPLNAPTEIFAISHHLMRQWKAHQGPGGVYGDFGFACRIKADQWNKTTKRMHIFVGLNDTGGAEAPIYDTGAGIQTPAGDFVGFAFMPGGDTGWTLVAAQNGTDQIVATGSATTPTDNVYEQLAFVVRRGAGDTGGTAYFFRNGKLLGKINNPVTGTVALTPWLGYWYQDTGPRVLDIDYVNVYALRDTGL